MKSKTRIAKINEIVNALGSSIVDTLLISNRQEYELASFPNFDELEKIMLSLGYTNARVIEGNLVRNKTHYVDKVAKTHVMFPVLLDSGNRRNFICLRNAPDWLLDHYTA